jgi:lambda family phage portal protein
MTLTDRFRSLFSIGAAPAASPTRPPAPPRSSRTSPGLRARATAYEAGAIVPRTSGWGAENPTANWATASASTIRARCRDATRNNAWARALVETFTDDVVGWGIGLLPRGTDTRTREAIAELWREWEELAGADGQNLAAVQVAAVRQVIVDGECFVRLRRRRPSDGLRVPLQLEVLPPEICPAEYSFGAREGHVVKDGIEFDAIGRRTAYFLREAIPGEDDGLKNSGTIRRIPADQVLHVFEPQRPGQRRGVPMLAAALVRLHELDKFEDAALLRQQMANMFAAFVRRAPQIDDELTDPLTGLKADPSNDLRTLALEPATVQELAPGEDIEFSDPPEASAAQAEFVKSHLRAAGAAVGVPYEVFSGDWGSTNDRLARVVLNQYRRRVLRFIWTVVVPQFLQPVYHEWLSRAMPRLVGMSMADAMRATWSLHAWPYVHPVQDVASTQQAIRAGLTSRAAAVGETGESVEQIDAEQAEDNARADKLGLRYDSDARQAKPARRTR